MQARLIHEIDQLKRQSKQPRSWPGVGNEHKCHFVSQAGTKGTREYIRHAIRIEKYIQNNTEDKKLPLRIMYLWS